MVAAEETDGMLHFFIFAHSGNIIRCPMSTDSVCILFVLFLNSTPEKPLKASPLTKPAAPAGKPTPAGKPAPPAAKPTSRPPPPQKKPVAEKEAGPEEADSSPPESRPDKPGARPTTTPKSLEVSVEAPLFAPNSLSDIMGSEFEVWSVG